MPPPPDREPTLVFVYGTLRPALAAGPGRALVAPLEPVGPATVRGILYDLGPYPALVPGDDLAHGDLLRIAEPEHLTALDDYEECGGPAPLYRREIVTARRPDGSEVRAWAFVYCRSVAGRARVPGGDYLTLSHQRTEDPPR